MPTIIRSRTGRSGQQPFVTDEMRAVASSYFVFDGHRQRYVGPKGEYQKWYYVIHKERKNQAAKDWRVRNLEYDKKRSREKGHLHRLQLKTAAILRVAGKVQCQVCGIDDIRVLTINHLNGDGYKERHDRISRTYRDIAHGRKTDDLDVRCYNCNILHEYDLGRRRLPVNWREIMEQEMSH